MKSLLLISSLALLSACAEESEALPPRDEVDGATLAYAQCIDEAVDQLDLTAGSIDAQVQSVRDDCAQERNNALRMRAVPIFAPTIEEFDEIHDGLAESLINRRNGI